MVSFPRIMALDLCLLCFISTAILCSALPAISDGVIMYSTDITAPFDFGTTATYSCNDGYFLQGSDTVRQCRDDSTDTTGDWSGTTPVCTGIHVYNEHE